MSKKKKEATATEWKEDENGIAALAVYSNTVRTVDAALKVADVDTKVWKVKHYTINKWDQGTALKVGEEKVVAVTELWQVKLWLERKYPEWFGKAVDELFSSPPSRFKAPPVKSVRSIMGEPHMLEVAVYDGHFGLYAWGEETGHDWDAAIAAKAFSNAVGDMLTRTKGYNIAQILYPIGQDFFHASNWLQTTAKGTPLDFDTRMQRVFELGFDAFVQSINACRKIAPVHLLWIPGNHDLETSWYLAKALDAYFRHEEDVTFDLSPKTRKRHLWGPSLIGFAHGEEKHQALPGIMAGEWPLDWAKSEFRHWHIGHRHKKAQMRYASADTYEGVVVTTIPSLCATDAWHYTQGYVPKYRAAECYLWGEEYGPVGSFSANLRA